MRDERDNEPSDFWIRGLLTREMCEHVITQAELARLQDLEESARQHRQLRKHLRSKVVANAPMESGDLMLSVKETESRAFSFDKLVAILGQLKTQELKDQIDPSYSIRLAVLSRDVDDT